MRFEGELNNSFAPAFAPGVVNTSHEITKRQWHFPRIGFHLRESVLMVIRRLIAKVCLGNQQHLLKPFWQCLKVRKIQCARIDLLVRLQCSVHMHVC